MIFRQISDDISMSLIVKLSSVLYFLIFKNVISMWTQNVTAIENGNVVLPCSIPPYLLGLPSHTCTWLRKRTTAVSNSDASNTNNKKYVSAGDLETGNCSLNITRVLLEEDEGIWSCTLHVNETAEEVLSVVNLTVLVTPLDPALYLDESMTSIPQNGTIHLEPNAEVTLKLKCISQLAFPHSNLMWKLNGKGIVPKSDQVYPDVRKSTFITVSSIEITHMTSLSDLIQISCNAFHPSYAGVKTVAAQFSVKSFPPTSAQIQSGCELKDAVENEIFKLEPNQILPLLCMTKGMPLPNIEWEMKNEYDEWKPIFKHTLQFALFAQSPGLYRCTANNNLSKNKVFSSPVLVELVPSKTDKLELELGHIDLKSYKSKRFLIEPRDRSVVIDTPFEMNCILSEPVEACTWIKNGQLLKEIDEDPSGRFEVSNDLENGDCSLRIKTALHEADEGNWVCQANLTENFIATSKPAKVNVLHPPTMLMLTYKGKQKMNGERISINVEDTSEAKLKTITLQCVSNVHDKNQKITWWINNRPETFPKTKVKALSINTYQISSIISLSVNNLPKSTKRSEIFVKCTTNNQGPEVVLKTEYPTEKVILFPSGSVFLKRNSYLRLFCTADGKPPPEVALQRQLGKEWQWMTSIPQRKWYSIKESGRYRCVAKNKLNSHYLHSRPTFILPAERAF